MLWPYLNSMYLVPPSIYLVYDIRVYYSARIFTASRYDILVYYGARIFTGMFTPSTAKVCLPYLWKRCVYPMDGKGMITSSMAK